MSFINKYPVSEVTRLHVRITIPEVEIYYHVGVKARKRFHTYFLYSQGPTHWRENWRNISGFSIKDFNRSLNFCVWRQI